MKCHVITLDETRIKPMLGKLQKNGINPVIFKGVNGKTCSKELIKEYVSEAYSIHGPKSAIGCAISHMKLWREFLKSNDPYVFIVEDDIIFTQKDTPLSQRIQKVLDNTPKDFDILYLGAFGSENLPVLHGIIMGMLQAGSKQEEKINEYVKKPKLALAAHAYILSRKGAEKLVENLYGELYNHVDYCIQQLTYVDKLTMYSASPRLIYQTSNESGVSENVKTHYPSLITNILSTVYIDDHLPLSYITSVSIAEINGMTINTMSVLFLIIGIICALSKVDIIQLISIFIAISILDLFDGKVDVIGFHFALFITPSLVTLGYRST